MSPTGNRNTLLAYTDAHPEEVSYLSARALGERCGVSESTVIRTVQTLGYRGYPDYQDAVRRDLTRRRTTVERFAAAHGADPVAQAFARDLENLQTTWAGLSEGTLQRARDLLVAAPRIWLLGLRSSYAVTVLLHQGLSFLGLDARLLDASHGNLLDGIYGAGAQDVLLAVALPRYTRLTVEGAALAHSRGTRILAISDGPSSPLAPMADVLLPVAYGLSGYVESFTAAVCLSQALLLAVAEAQGPRGLRALQRREALWTEWNVYWQD